MPEAYPRNAEHHGSFSVVHNGTRSPSRAAASAAYSAKPLAGGAGAPAAGLLQLLGQVPVVERRHRLDAAAEEFVDEPGVEVEA